MNVDFNSLAEPGKSFARFLFFGLLGLVGTFLVSLATSADLLQLTWTVQDVVVPVGAWLATAFGFIAKALDLYVRKSDNNDLNGIAPNFLQK